MRHYNSIVYCSFILEQAHIYLPRTNQGSLATFIFEYAIAFAEPRACSKRSLFRLTTIYPFALSIAHQHNAQVKLRALTYFCRRAVSFNL